jgi:glycosyltransferase involved in cell wall biosynthesis
MARAYSFASLVGHSAAAAARALVPGPALGSGERSSEPEHLLIFSQVVWHDVWQRPQEIAERLSRRVPVTFVGPTPVHRMLEARDRWVERQTRCGGRLTVHSPLMVPGEYRSALIRRFNAGHALRLVRRLRIAPASCTLFLNSPFVPALVERVAWGLVVYDWMDDFTGFRWAPRGSDALERRTMARVDLSTAGTQFLSEAKREVSGDITFVPNGVRFEAFSECDDPRPADLPEGFDHVIGYVGTLSDRFDTELVEGVAGENPRAAVVLIGPQHGSLGRPPRGENIFLLGLRPHGSLPAYLRHFDVGLIPFRTGRGAEAVNPTKLLEYAAAGVPVVSTALPDVVHLFGDCVGIGETAEAFGANVKRALAGGMREEQTRATERARAASWDETADRLWALILEAWRRKADESPSRR